MNIKKHKTAIIGLFIVLLLAASLFLWVDYYYETKQNENLEIAKKLISAGNPLPNDWFNKCTGIDCVKITMVCNDDTAVKREYFKAMVFYYKNLRTYTECM